MDKELYHHGVKGQKWGVRRTPAQLGHTTSKKRKTDKEDSLKSVNTIVKETARIASTAKQASERKTAAKRDAAKKKMSLDNMTDKELRDMVNRRILENQYRDLYTPATVSKGRERVNKFLGAVGTTMTVTSSALAIALSIKKLAG